MAQTRRRRRTKHRGNAAGVVESRGRTGRKPTASEKAGTPDPRARQKSAQREEKEPTWRSAVVRSMFAAVMMLAILLIFKLTKPAAAIELFPIVLIFYIPVSYYTERWTYNRRQRKRAQKKPAGR
ncbi:MAG TPA: hypothetical protein VHT27_05750 [Solirubrobacteraceae bacterium]|jgi:anti-sigma-K factor RskA|nr:hypothetical protein [Solirubrobacteraceae bacterium]